MALCSRGSHYKSPSAVECILALVPVQSKASARARARFRLRNRLRLREDPLCRRVVRIYMPRMHPPVFSLIQHRGAADAFKDHCLLIRSPFRLASVSMGIVVSFDTKCRSELSEPRITSVIILCVARHGINPKVHL